MLNIAAIVIENLLYHTNKNGVVSHADSTYLNESMNSLRYNGRKLFFLNRLKYAVKIFSICVDVYKSYEGDDFDKIYEVLSTLKYKKLKINNTLVEIHKEMLKNPNFEQNRY